MKHIFSTFIAAGAAMFVLTGCVVALNAGGNRNTTSSQTSELAHNDSELDKSAIFGASVNRIWDNGYSAFPSIVSFRGKYYVSFREAKSHVFDENGIAAGASRIIVSEDGVHWKSAALLKREGFDLRDPKLSVTPDGRLMVTMGGSIYEDKILKGQIPHVSFSADGENFSDPVPVVFDENITDNEEWIWRVTWKGSVGYGVTYGKHFALLKTLDGLHYEYVTELSPDTDGTPGESTIRFTKDGRMLMMIRCEGKDDSGRWGVSEYPYTDWKWSQIDFHMGGPDFIVLDDGSIVAGSRYTFPSRTNKTLVLRGDADGKFEEMFLVPSAGDTSYPGFIEVGDEIWMVYYSCHESINGTLSDTMYQYESGKARKYRAAIYLAKFQKSIFK